jgi:anti-repressor protein
MEQLIKITTTPGGKRAVFARELYDFLGFDKSQWSRWYKKNIEDNPYSEVNKDWQGFDTMSNGNPTKDFVLTIDFAKRLSMLARTEKGEEIRNYFIACEKVANQPK